MAAQPSTDDGGSTTGSERFKKLPARIPLEDTITTLPAEAPPDPTMGRDPEVDFMLRNAGG